MLKDRVYLLKRLLMFVNPIQVGSKHVLDTLVASQHKDVLCVYSPNSHFNYLLTQMV